MALDKQLVEIQLGGIDTLTDPKLLPNGSLVDLQNCDFRLYGDVSKRNGYTAYNLACQNPANNRSDSATTFSTGSQLWRHRDELMLDAGKGQMFTRRTDPALTPYWLLAGRFMQAKINEMQIASTNQCQMVEVGYTSKFGGVIAVVYGKSVSTPNANGSMTGAYMRTIAFSATTGAIVMPDQPLGDNGGGSVSTSDIQDFPARIVTYSDNNMAVVFKETGGAGLHLYVYNLAVGSNGKLVWSLLSNTTAEKTVGGDVKFDAAAYPAGGAGSGTGVVVYRNNVGTVYLYTMSPSSVSGPSLAIAVDADMCISVGAKDTTHMSIIMGTTAGTAGLYESIWTNNVGASAPSLIYGSALGGTPGYDASVVGDGTYIYTAFTIESGTQPTIKRGLQFYTSGTGSYKGGFTANAVYRQHGYMRIASKPFVYNNNVYVIMLSRSTYYVVWLSSDGAGVGGTTLGINCTGHVVMKLYSDEANPLWNSNSVRPRNHQVSVVPMGSGKFVTGLPVSLALTSTGQAITRPAYVIFTLGTNRGNAGADTEGAPLLLASGEVKAYDTRSMSELGFNEYPTIAAAVSGGTVNGQLSNGTYLICALYVYTDAIGDVHFGPVSLPTSVTLSGGTATQYIDVTVDGLNTTDKDFRQDLATQMENGAYINIYRTIAGGTAYYLDKQITNLGNAGFEVTNAWLTGSVGKVYTDATLIANQALYTAGGVLENVAPPPAMSVVYANHRAFLYVGSDTLWFSQKYTSGTGLSFCAELTKTIQPDNNSDVALAEMDGNVIIFREGNVQFFTGDGPTANGLNDQFSEVRVISTDFGIIAGSPTVRTGQGIFFKSNKGFCLLTRSLEIVYIGGPVDSMMSLTLVSAVAVPTLNQVRFGHSDGSCAAYDYEAKKWSIYSNHTQVDAVLFQDKYTYLMSSGVVMQEDTTYVDNAASIGMVVETPWIHVAGIQGFKRIYNVSILGTWKSAHSLTLQVYLDYATAAVETKTFDASTGYSAGDPLQIRHNIGHQCQSVKFRITDSIQAGTKESCVLTGIAMEVGIMGGLRRQAAAKTI